jgi:trehalose-6-phosphate synthase
VDADPLRQPRLQPLGSCRPLSNLVAKEYIAAQDPDDPGVLILSRFAGAAVECKRALLVNPYDAESVAAAMAQALTMPLEERRERHAALMAAITANNIDKWQNDFLHALSNEDSSLEEIQTAIQATQSNLQERARTATIGQIPVAGP